jgi:hypothetical protein
MQSVSLAEVAQHAVEQSKLTLTGSTPFHLRAKIVETTNPHSDYKAEIEEYWVSSDKLRRTITSPEFSQTLIVSGDNISEQNSGDYVTLKFMLGNGRGGRNDRGFQAAKVT